MRADADPKRILDLLAALGREATGPGSLYLTGGATAVLHGWRSTTLDVDLSFSPEPPGVFAALGRLKDLLDLNIELASPAHFIPELPGWRDRSIFIERHGRLDCFHYDLYSQALSKVERGHPRDRLDVAAMLSHGLVERGRLRALFDSVVPSFERFPAIDPDEFRAKLEEALGVPAQ